MNQKIYNVKDIVNNALKGSRLLKQGLIKGNWEKIIGSELGRKTFVDKIKDNVLYVNTENPVILHQLSFLKEDIIEKVNNFLEINYIKNIFFKVRKREINDIFFYKEEEININIDDIILENQDKILIEETIKNIEDVEIRKKIKKIMELSKKKEKYLLGEGNKKCVYCGALFNSSRKICINCYNEERKEKIGKIFQLIKMNPYVAYKELNNFLPDLREDEYEDIKSKIKEKVKVLMYREINRDDEEKFRYYAKIYFILETGLKDKNDIERLINSQLLQFE